MIRDYNDGVQSGIVPFFIGYEVEKTSCYGLKTLFVTGKQLYNDIKNNYNLNNCEHIYFGANKSFELDFDVTWVNSIISDFLFYGYDAQFTIDLPYKYWHKVSEIYKHPSVHINLSVVIPHINCRNLNVKIDDIDFKATNPGVWVFNMNEQRNNFTSWDEYKEDKII